MSIKCRPFCFGLNVLNRFCGPKSHQISAAIFKIRQLKKNADDVIEWKPFPHYWPFVRGIHRSPFNSTHKGPVMRAVMFIWCGYA